MNSIGRALRRALAARVVRPFRSTSLRVAALVTLLGIASPAIAESAPRTLFILLDAIRYEDAVSVRERTGPDGDLFAGFSGPVPLVSTFPSTTSLAIPGLLAPFGLAKSPGYEARFFDHDRGEVRGGGLISYHKIHFPWREFFDWEVRGLARKTLLYAWPLRGIRKEIGQAVGAFLASDRRFFFAYVNSTDATSHLYGPERTRAALEALGRALRDVRERHPELEFHTVILSDHGMGGGPPLRNALPGIERALRREGWKKRKKLRSSHDAVLLPFGLLSSLVAHTAPGREGALARALASAEGVEICAYPDGRDFRVLDGDGEALFRRSVREGRVRWSYTPVSGDPLGYAPVLADLGEPSDSDGARWLEDEVGFEATLDHRFPDALHRIARSFDLVENPASVVCSIAPGWLYGSRGLVLGARLSRGRLRWTHGALRREESLGFLMSDHPEWDPPIGVRFDSALRFFTELPGVAGDAP